jgi:uncharacterized SAM-binding protein YcdF (DUF218 family)
MVRFLKRLAVGVLGFGLLCVLLWAGRAPLLRGCANLWIVNQEPARADAIVVLGGGLENRPFAAAKLFRAGLAPKILLMNVKPAPTTELGILPTEEELTRKVLLSQGVPETNLVAIGQAVANSHDEALAVREWGRQTGARRLIIVTDLFHTRRVRWLYAKELAGTGMKVTVVAVRLREYSAQDWWLHEQGLISFQNEVLKYVFYRIRY